MSTPLGGSSMARRLALVHRIGAATVGLGLVVFGIVGLLTDVAFLSTDGDDVLGMSSNGLLAVLSLVVGVVLVGAGLRGDGVASAVTAVLGALFLLSGFANLAVLDSDANVLAFEMANVVFSFAVGILLVVLGLYGRVSGAPPAENPYRLAREQRHPSDKDHRGDPEIAAPLADEETMIRAEIAMAEGHPSVAQTELYLAEARRHADAEHRRAWEHYRQTNGTE